MALKTYWCVLSQMGTTAIRGRTVFREVDGFSYDLDLDEGTGSAIRAALVTGIKQHGGEEADISEYRLNILDAQYGRVLLPDYASSPEAVAYRAPDSLAGYTDDQLIRELARRLRNRG
jgi:hypothetical protein